MKGGKLKLSAACALGAAALIILLRTADVRPIGAGGTEVGLAALNWFIFESLGVNFFLYELTDRLGIAAILTALGFATVGLCQLIARRSLLKVDGEILALGALYLAVTALYLVFESFVVNCRPVIMPGCAEPEASFPSSHTMLVCVIMGGAAIIADRYVAGRKLRAALRAVCALIIGVTVIGRLFSGVHWFTDILGGLLISAALLLFYAEIIERIDRNER